MPLKYEVKEQAEIRKRSEEWHADIAGYRIFIERRDDGVICVHASPSAWKEGLRQPSFSCYPKSVEDFERLAQEGPALFQAIATEMRAAGLVDLRSRWDKWEDKRQAWEQHYKNTGELIPMPVDDAE